MADSPPQPNPDLRSLDRLVGTWAVSDPSGHNAISGTVTYEWMEGGFFLLQHVHLDRGDHQTKGLEIIGHEQPFGAPPSPDIKSRYYDNLGSTFDYVYELTGDTLTIWGGTKNSPAYYRGTFSADGNTNTGAWVYPGGGYASSMTRMR
jgi:hypothetical protein